MNLGRLHAQLIELFLFARNHRISQGQTSCQNLARSNRMLLNVSGFDSHRLSAPACFKTWKLGDAGSVTLTSSVWFKWPTIDELRMDKKRLGNGVKSKDKNQDNINGMTVPEPRIMEQKMRNSNEQQWKRIDQEFSTYSKDERSRKLEKTMDIKDEDGVPRNPQILKWQALSTLCHGACILAFCGQPRGYQGQMKILRQGSLHRLGVLAPPRCVVSGFDSQRPSAPACFLTW